MRAIRLCLMVAACLAFWQTPIVGAGPSPESTAAWATGGNQTEQRLFYDNQFVYMPPPTPDLTSNPKFYVQRFRAAPPADPAVASPTPNASSVPDSSAVAAIVSTPTATYAVISTTQADPTATAVPAQAATALPETPTVAPTAPPVQPTATPAPTQVASVAQYTGVMEPTATRFVLGGNSNPLFHEGAFRYTAPATPPSIDDPRFYRGSFSINQAGHLAPTPAAAPTQVSNAAAQGQADATLTDGQYAAMSPDTKVVAPPTSGVVTYDRLNPSYNAQSPLPVRGRAMYYNPGIMSEVLSYRLQLNQVQACGNCVGYVALLRAGDLNRKVWLQWDDGTVEGPFLVIDVAARQHVPSLLARNWVADVDYRTAIRRGMNRPLPVTILAAPPVSGDKPAYSNLVPMTGK